jgi:hypothetical protein
MHVQSALAWVDGSMTGTAPAAAKPLRGRLTRCLQLLSARLQLSGQPPPLAHGPLAAPWAAPSDDDPPDAPVQPLVIR